MKLLPYLILLTLVSSPAYGLVGDLNNDQIVNDADVNLLFASWGSSHNDLTGDGIVDAADASIVFENWGLREVVLVTTPSDSATLFSPRQSKIQLYLPLVNDFTIVSVKIHFQCNAAFDYYALVIPTKKVFGTMKGNYSMSFVNAAGVRIPLFNQEVSINNNAQSPNGRFTIPISADITLEGEDAQLFTGSKFPDFNAVLDISELRNLSVSFLAFYEVTTTMIVR